MKMEVGTNIILTMSIQFHSSFYIHFLVSCMCSVPNLVIPFLNNLVGDARLAEVLMLQASADNPFQQ